MEPSSPKSADIDQVEQLGVKVDNNTRFYLMELICKLKNKERDWQQDLVLQNAPLKDQIEVKKGRSCFAGPSLFNANY